MRSGEFILFNVVHGTSTESSLLSISNYFRIAETAIHELAVSQNSLILWAESKEKS
jgi:hypothetical protein